MTFLSSVEVDFDVFPTVSHVQQKSPDNVFWDLPKTELKLLDSEPVNLEIGYFTTNMLTEEFVEKPVSHELSTLNKIRSYKRIIKDIKTENPNYPVYKIFKSIYNKSGYKIEKQEGKSDKENKASKTASKRRGRKKKNSLDKSVEIVDPVPVTSDAVYAMWTEKYKAKTSGEHLGNRSSVSTLKEWLGNWLITSSEGKKKKSDYDSESEFETTDGDSRDSMKFCGNTAILKGPHGCGKSTAVYAVCNELGFNVLEVNASSKRTGKWLLQELQEATQSHQVRKKENHVLSFVKEETKEEPVRHKMCVLLVEDVDIVFEQDEGFTTALTQIMNTSKRPIILTTNDETSANIQKIITHHQVISFSPLSSILGVWLQIVCLIEGYYVNAKSLEELLSYNKGDVRRTLLQLQFWVTSGADLNKNENKKIKNAVTAIKTEFDSDSIMEDDNSNLSDLRLDEINKCDENVSVNNDCVSSFEIVKNYKTFSLPYCNNSEVIWWNLPNILNLPNFSNLRLERDEKNCCNSPEITSKFQEKRKLEALSVFYDSLAFTDIICGKDQFHESLERKWRTKPKDSIRLEENMNSFKDHDFIDELSHTLLSGSIEIYRENYADTCSSINMAVPTSIEKRWHTKHTSCEEKLEEALLPSDWLERKAVALDYMPTLRDIARFEVDRATNNTKRRNRFYNYLKNLGVSGGDSTYNLACNIFKVND